MWGMVKMPLDKPNPRVNFFLETAGIGIQFKKVLNKLVLLAYKKKANSLWVCMSKTIIIIRIHSQTIMLKHNLKIKFSMNNKNFRLFKIRNSKKKLLFKHSLHSQKQYKMYKCVMSQ